MDVRSATEAIDRLGAQPDQSPEVFEQLAAATGSRRLIFFSARPDQPDLGGDPAASDMQAAYADGWRQIDQVTPTIQRMRSTRLMRTQDAFHADFVAQDPFSQEFLRKWGGPWGAGQHFWIGQEHYWAALMRETPYSDKDLRQLGPIMSSLTQSLKFAPTWMAAHEHGIENALERLDTASICLDWRGRVSFVSPAAASLLDQDFGVREGVLWARETTAEHILNALTAAARNRLAPLSRKPYAAPRGLERRPMIISARRFPNWALDWLPGARLLLTLVDLEKPQFASSDLLRDIFGLSSTEAKVAMLLAAGIGAEDIAERLTLNVSTIRQHIKAALNKTSTHRQAELVALICRLAGSA